MRTFEKIPVILDERPTIITNEIVAINEPTRIMSEEIVAKGREIARIAREKEARKTAIQRQMDGIFMELLEYPEGLTPTEILLKAESDNLITTLNSLRSYLKSNNLYTLKKKKRAKINRYYLDPIR